MADPTKLREPSTSFQVAFIKGKYYTPVADAAACLGVSETFIYREFKKRENPFETTTFGGRVVVELDSLKAEAARRGMVIPEPGEVSR